MVWAWEAVDFRGCGSTACGSTVPGGAGRHPLRRRPSNQCNPGSRRLGHRRTTAPIRHATPAADGWGPFDTVAVLSLSRFLIRDSVNEGLPVASLAGMASAEDAAGRGARSETPAAS